MTKKDVLSPDAPDLVSEATAWLAQLETGKLSKEDLAAFREWVQRSPRHYVEIRRLAELSREVNVLAGMAAPLREAAKRQRIVRRATPSRRAAPMLGWGALGMVATCALAFAIFTGTPGSQPVEPEPVYLVTPVGETREVALEDGSKVKLNTDSRVEVAFAKGRRNVYLEKGEAFFEVAHDTARPFTVYAGDRSVTAVGTAFSVRWTDEELVVTVSEGRVAYGEAPVRAAKPSAPGVVETLPAAAPSQPAARKMLGAGQRLEVSPLSRAELIERLPENVLSRELAWRSGFLDFQDAPLREVVSEMQRYTSQEIVIDDEELAELRFGGVFRIGQTEAFFEALELSFGVDVEQAEDNKLILRSAD
ncbi:FecR family protein [Hyphomonas sp. NPDC076900]|uniref:FecR family protein n=1 Tax=unclassified Hyphomonas TaxID=2630699 RepID=UPI003CFC01F5